MVLYLMLDRIQWPSPYLAGFLGITLLLLVTFYGIRHGRTLKSTQTIPLAGVENGSGLLHRWKARLTFFKNGPTLIHDAYEKYSDSIFELPTLDRRSIVLPAKYLKDIRYLSEHIANNGHATSDFFIGKWTTLDLVMFGHANVEAIRAQYISNIGSQVRPAAEEIDYALSQKFTEYPDWTPIAPHPKILHTVAQTVARTVVGQQVCRDPAWVPSVVGYAQNVFMAAMSLKITPWPLRPLTALLTPYLYRIHAHRRAIRKIITPVISQRLHECQVWGKKIDRSRKTSIDWLIELSPPDEAVPDIISHRLTGISFGASHTTTNTVVNALFDLAARFDEYAPALREEIKRELGSDMSEPTVSKLSNMRKLDSFLKESQRFHPPSKLSVNRTVLAPLHLPSGEVIEPGTHISFAGVPMSVSERYLDHAAEFDGFRFERMRSDPNVNHNGLQFTSSYEPSLHFGYGRYMCPGRFMGSTICKLVLIALLKRYDFCLKEGERRPENIVFYDSDIPNPNAQILFRDRVMR